MEGQPEPPEDGGSWVLDCFSFSYRHKHTATCYRWMPPVDDNWAGPGFTARNDESTT